MDNFIRRSITPVIHGCLKEFPAVLLTGARQSGKTTLLKQEFADSFSFTSLDDAANRIFAQEDPAGFLNQHPAPLIIDEFQYAPGLLNEIKMRIDHSSQRPGQFLLTGSQRFEIIKGITETMAGRVAVLQLPCFSFREVEPGQGKSIFESQGSVPERSFSRAQIIELLTRSWFPRAKDSRRKDIWFESYLQTYADRDVTQVLQIRDTVRFRNFITLLAGRAGQVFNQSAISKDAGIDAKTAGAWLHLLEMSDLVYLLYPWKKRHPEQVIKSPKIYFMDNGLLLHLNGIRTPSRLESSDFLGRAFENFVVIEAVKAFLNLGLRPRLNFWRTYQKQEVDLLVDMEDRLFCVECKLNATPQKKHITNMQAFMAMNGEFDHGYVVSSVSRTQKIAVGIEYVNLSGVL